MDETAQAGQKPHTVQLRHPVQHGGVTITELTFRPARAKDFRRFKMETGYEIEGIIVLAGRLCGQPDIVIDQLTGDDLAEVIDLVTGFMPGSPKTGGEPSPS